MDKSQWLYFKRNNLKLTWRNATASWCATLPYKLPLIDFIRNNFTPDKIHYKLQKLRFLITRKPAMPTLEYVITTKCTMNCKHCNTFIPYFSNKTHSKITTFNEFKKDLDTLLKAVDYIDYFGFVGGEPMLCKELDKMIKYAASKRKLHHIFLATNCTILPSDNLLKVMKNKKFAVQLSDYRDVKFNNGITVKYNEFKKLLTENNIQFSHPEEDNDRLTFQSMPELYPDKQDFDKVKNIFNKCWGQYCNMLCEGILTQCTLSVYITRNLELTKEVEDELVNIREKQSPKELTEKIINFYARPYSAFCHYCHSDNIQYGLPVGEQMEEILNETY